MDATTAQPTKRSLRSNRANEADGGPVTKKRAVRKGTRSCWECRRRKMKCIFSSPADSICISCRRRGAECVGQQFPEVISTSLDRSLQMSDRVVRVEALVEKLLQTAPDETVSVGSVCEATNDRQIHSHGILTPASIESASPQSTGANKSPADAESVQYEVLDGQRNKGLGKSQSTKDLHAGPGDHGGLSKVLHRSLPTPKDIEIIAGVRGKVSTRFFEMTTTTYNDLDRAETKSLESLLESPGPNVHPVLMARHMLWVATFLQHLHPHLHAETAGLSEPPGEMMKRLADTSIRLVTMNDDLLGSVEGLECLMVESMYHTNGGNLRRGLIAVRRAITIAQLMGIHRPGIHSARCTRLSRETRPNPSFIWYRILFYERHLCLMLGLPQSTLDHSMASEAMLATDSPMGRLERIHCTIASRILERNQSDPSPKDVLLTQELDGQLRQTAEGLPRKWWLAANLANAGDPEALFWDMRRSFHQLFHYNLLNLLHLPYMLRSNSSGDGDDYSRITCVSASREVLSRFMMLESNDRIAFWCRTMHFFSLMAAMTLIIAHIDGHRRCAAVARICSQQQNEGWHMQKTDNLLTHQRPGDRAMVEQVQESMEEMSRLKEDALGAQSAELLQRLLVIEAEAAVVAAGRAQPVGDQNMQRPTIVEDQAVESERDESGAVRVHIPHFGAINISRDGNISKEVPQAIPSTACAANPIQQLQIPLAGAIDAIGSGGTNKQAATYSSGFDTCAGSLRPSDAVPSDVQFDRNEGLSAETDARGGGFSSQPIPTSETFTDTHFTPSNLITFSNVLLQQEGQPQAAGVDDWALQGVDIAFFDSLMREVGDGTTEGSNWHTDLAK